MRNLLTLFITATFLFSAWDLCVTNAQPESVISVSGENRGKNEEHPSVYFEQNKGQFGEKVRFFARGTSRHALFLTATDAVYVLPDEIRSEAPTQSPKDKPAAEVDVTAASKAVAVYMTLTGAKTDPDFLGLRALDHRTNYFIGSDDSKWHTDIPNFESVRAHRVYDGIDMIWRGNKKGQVHYDFILEPHADPSQIAWEIQGADGVELTSQGGLLIKAGNSAIEQPGPSVIRQLSGSPLTVQSSFVIDEVPGGPNASKSSFRVRLLLGEVVQNLAPLIDSTVNIKTLAFSTFLGGFTNDQAVDIAVDDLGYVYVTGNTISSSFPTTPGSFDTTRGRIDAYVTKFNPAGSALIYSTFIGGNQVSSSNTGNEYGLSIALDAVGNAYVTGTTDSVDFPTTSGAYNTTINLHNDVFVTKLNATGSALFYSTYIGGRSSEEARDIYVDSSGNAFITGSTGEDALVQYPTTPGAFSTVHSGNGHREAFVTKLNAAGSGLVYSTFLGGTDHDDGYAIVADSDGNAFVTGYTFDGTVDFPTTEGSYNRIHKGESDAFLSKLNPSGSDLVFSTLLGGSSLDFGLAVDIDQLGNVLVAGETQVGTINFPTTPGAYDESHNGERDAFVTKLDRFGSQLEYSTLIGGTGFEGAYDIDVSISGDAYLTGFTESTDFPTTDGSFDSTHNGARDVFVSKLSPVGKSVPYSTFIGGGASEIAFGIVVDSNDNAFVAGRTWWFTDIAFPTTSGAFNTTHNGDNDAFITKLGTASVAGGFDFDGDGKTDVSVFRPSAGEWWWQRSSDGQVPAVQFGSSTDVIAPADFTGDGKTDTAFWRPSTGEWFVLRSEDFSFYSFPFGGTGDIPVPADYDGDGKADPAVFRPSSGTWFIFRSSDSQVSIVGFGLSGDQPVPADYDGDGKADVGIFRPNGASGGEWWIQRSTAGLLAVQFGNSTDRIVPGDYTGDGKADVAFWRPASGEWFILRSEDLSFYSFPFGGSGDIPTQGDYDGDGKADAAVFRPSAATWYIQGSMSGTMIHGFGTSTDQPVPSAFVR